MGKHPRGSFWLAALLLGVALLVGVGALVGGNRKPERRLPDSSLLTLEAVTYGKEHRFVHGSWWQKLLAPVLPASIKNQLRVDTLTSDSPDTLVLWTRRRGATPGQALGQPFWQTRVFAVDERGRAAETGDLRFRSEPPDGPAMETLEAWALPAFPRRGRTVGLRLYTQDAAGRWVQAAEFTVPNPSSGPHPTWTPEPLPITKRDGDLAVTLTGFSTGVTRLDPRREAAAGEESWTHVTFRFSRKGRPAPAWHSAGFVLSDATGNVCSRTHDLFSTRLPDGERFSFRGTLWPGEPAWKLRFRFMRRSGFAPAELWTVSGLAVPGKRSGSPLSRQAYRQGTTLKLLAITGPGGTMPGSAPGGKEPSVQIRMSPPSDDLQLTLFRAVDDRGRDVTPGFATLMPDGFLSFELPGAAGAKRVSLTFAVQKPRAVEFLVSPAPVAVVSEKPH